MFNLPQKCSTSPRRVRAGRSVATSRADTADGPRPIVSRPHTTAAAEQRPGRPRVNSSEQSTEPPRDQRAARSHSQDRKQRMDTPHTPQTPPPPAADAALFVGIDVAK